MDPSMEQMCQNGSTLCRLEHRLQKHLNTTGRKGMINRWSLIFFEVGTSNHGSYGYQWFCYWRYRLCHDPSDFCVDLHKLRMPLCASSIRSTTSRDAGVCDFIFLFSWFLFSFFPWWIISIWIHTTSQLKFSHYEACLIFLLVTLTILYFHGEMVWFHLIAIAFWPGLVETSNYHRLEFCETFFDLRVHCWEQLVICSLWPMKTKIHVK